MAGVVKMADFIRNPINLIFNVGKNLVVNGIDILGKVTEAVTCFQKNDYFGVGKAIGEVLVSLSQKHFLREKMQDYNPVMIRTHDD